jgi:hypothetical protein
MRICRNFGQISFAASPRSDLGGQLELVLGPLRFILDIFFEHGLVDSGQRGLLPLGIPSNSRHQTGMSHCQHKVAHANAKLKALFFGRIDLFNGGELNGFCNYSRPLRRQGFNFTLPVLAHGLPVCMSGAGDHM